MSARLARVNGALRWYEDDAKRRYAFELTCPRCSADVEHVSGGRSYPWHTVAAMKCSECRWQGAVTVELATIAEGSAQTTRIERERRTIERERAMT